MARFHQEPIVDDLRYLLLDGVSMRVKGALEVKRRLVLCANGITRTGQRRLVAYELARAESAAAWEGFLSGLREQARLRAAGSG